MKIRDNNNNEDGYKKMRSASATSSRTRGYALATITHPPSTESGEVGVKEVWMEL